ncbi:MAG: hypothetical protein ABIR18_10375 [Chitinophagaceae bacterium]
MFYPAFTMKDILKILFLCGIAIAIFYPLFYSEYAYTDEIVQLWYYKKGSDFQMFTPQGRYITDKLFQWLFSSATTIKDISSIRLFSLVGWLLSIPVWYYIIKRVVVKEKLPEILVFFSTLYIVCMPQFCIYVSWASCLELFLANTTGLLSGYFLYVGLQYIAEKKSKFILYVVLSVIAGLISLFTYQNGFGCFLLPFLLHLISTGKISRQLIIGVIGYLAMYGVYYLLFKYSLHANNIEASNRTGISGDIAGKFRFLSKKALPSSFHFTYIFNEQAKSGKIIYRVLLGVWVIANFIRQREMPVFQRIVYPLIIFLFCAMIYLPSLLVKENYASNRTLFALNLAVFFLVMHTVIVFIKEGKGRIAFVSIIGGLFIVNAWYNFNKLFLSPITHEYNVLNKYIRDNYTPVIQKVYFIRPAEDFFVSKYHITRSWDELGVPSSFFDWVPPFLVKQVVFEKTGDRLLADKIDVQHWLGKEEFDKSGIQPGDNTLVIDAETLLMSN